jgi:hypothetical protein
MSFPTSQNTDPVFLEYDPDWGQEVTVEGRCLTGIVASRSDGEQRSRKRQIPRFAITYQVPALTPAEFSLYLARMLQIQGAPVIVPIWTDALILTSMPTVNSADLTTASLTYKKFKKDSWAYMTQAGKVSTFRKISSIAGTVLSFTSGDLNPGGVKTFTAGAKVYPCILGWFPEGGSYKARRVTESDGTIAVEEL